MRHASRPRRRWSTASRDTISIVRWSIAGITAGAAGLYFRDGVVSTIAAVLAILYGTALISLMALVPDIDGECCDSGSPDAGERGRRR